MTSASPCDFPLKACRPIASIRCSAPCWTAREKFLRFLRALLGGLDATVDWAQGEGDGPSGADWGIGAGGDTLLDDLVRTAARDPDRLKPVRRLIDDLRKTDEGRRIVPDDLVRDLDSR